jgi:hypothetical protein
MRPHRQVPTTTMVRERHQSGITPREGRDIRPVPPMRIPMG